MMREMFIVGGIIFLLGGTAGFYARPFIFNPLSPRQTESLVQIIEERSPALISNQNIIGKVISVSAEKITVDTFGYNPSLLLGEKKDIREVTVLPGTKLSATFPKDDLTLEEERVAFEQKFKQFENLKSPDGSLSAPPTPPSFYEERMISPEEIIPGSVVTIIGPQKILFLKSFEAQLIQVISQP